MKPSARNGAGYRLYGERDLVRLQQIATLKFIGLPLRQIKDLLDRSELDLAATLRLQRGLLAEKYQQITRAIQAIDEAERAMKSSSKPDWAALKKIIEVMEMEGNMDWTKKYYSEEAQAKIAEHGRAFTPEMQAKVQQDWKSLIGEVEAAITGKLDPGSAKAKALAQRWHELVRGFTGGDREIQKGLNKLYADEQNWPQNFQKPFSDEVCEYIAKAARAHGISS